MLRKFLEMKNRSGIHVSDYCFIFVIFLIILMMVIPLPLAIMDVLVFFSLSFAVLTLMMTLYVAKPIYFSSFPVILLTLAVFRISLSVSTTRNILIHGETGDIIAAFGEFAIAGNIIVGIVIFLIITVVQFVVINKGSERVAEVGARFSLDALPGKQMSIDADVRAGSLDTSSAQTKRSTLQKESEFHGAMDGSMKFLKGDAIAGVVIMFVNFLGGLTIGMGQRGLTFDAAIEQYTTLTIGDGLVAQIPSIFTAISAGILVTRITNGDNGHSTHSLASGILKQFRDQPNAILAAAIVVAGVAFFPGFPLAICLMFAATLFVTYLFVKNRREEPRESPRHQLSSFTNVTLVDLDQVYTTEVLLSPKLAQCFSAKEFDFRLGKAIAGLSKAMLIPYPYAICSLSSELETGQYLVTVNGQPSFGGALQSNHVYAVNCDKILSIAGVEAEEFKLPDDGSRHFSFASSEAGKVRAFGVEVMTPDEFVISRIKSKLLADSDRYLNFEYVTVLLAEYSKHFPEAAKELQKAVSPMKLYEILRILVSEQVPLRDYRSLFEHVLEASAQSETPYDIVQNVRCASSQVLTLQALCCDGQIYCVTLGERILSALNDGLMHSAQGPKVALAPEQHEALMGAIYNTWQSWQLEVGKLVLLAPIEIRMALRRLLQHRFPMLRVLAVEELRPDVRVDVFGHIELPGFTAPPPPPPSAPVTPTGPIAPMPVPAE